jgi:radical SAM protein with 4Fe4S-binding SPASM domain
MGTDEMSTVQGKALIDDLAAYGAPVILFSGGEPLLRDDLSELAAHAVSRGMRAVISSNGTLISPQKAAELKSVGLSYVGISLDGIAETHDAFRRCPGAFAQTLEGIDNCKAEGLKVGLLFTVNRRNAHEIPKLFDLIRDMDIPRVCFYHLVYSGRGTQLKDEGLSPAETRNLLDLVMDRTRELFEAGYLKEVLTVDNHADGPYVWLRLLRENPERAAAVMELLQYNGGNSSCLGIACVSWDGSVHADQFWRKHTFGNVLERPFSAIWDDPSIELLQKLKDKKHYVQGRCAECRFLNICGGNFRARAEAVYNDIWASDPACYLSDMEIKA